MVHDSYCVHACDVDLLHRVLREEFVRIYSEPVLQNFLNEQRAAYPYIDLPDVPKPGTWISVRSSSPHTFLRDDKNQTSSLQIRDSHYHYNGKTFRKDISEG